jgi:predicted O-methyltransferase YrrM
MNTRLRTLLQELEESGLQNDAQQQERRNKMLNLEPETALLLSMLVRSGRRKNLLEIGTSNGYSTIWLAWSTHQFGGHVISVDRDMHKQELADKNLRHAGLRETVELMCGEATEIVANLSGLFDCVFFDADRLSAPTQLKLLLPKLTSDALVLADNALSHPEEIAGYLEVVKNLKQFDSLIIPVGKGLSVAYRDSGD